MATRVAVRDDLTQIFQAHLLLNFRLRGRTFGRRMFFRRRTPFRTSAPGDEPAGLGCRSRLTSPSSRRLLIARAALLAVLARHALLPTSTDLYRPLSRRVLSRSPQVPHTSCIQVTRPIMFSGDEMFMLTKWTRTCAHAAVTRSPSSHVAGRPGGVRIVAANSPPRSVAPANAARSGCRSATTRGWWRNRFRSG